MNDSQHPQTLGARHHGHVPGDEGPARRATDDDVALGCECADPVLQIERWGQEGHGPLRENC